MSQQNVVTAEYWHLLEDGRIQCDLCPRECKLKEGQRGFCYVRSREQESMVLNSYGLSSGYSIDPIEKKPLNHFLPGTPVLSFGTAGCNLACKFCQNWNISKSKEMQTLSDQASPEKIAHAAGMSGCRSVAYTYNDPVIFFEYARDTAQACREKDIKSVAVTAGYISQKAHVDFFKYIDAANVDLKAFTESFYRNVVGGSLEPVLETLKYIKQETDIWLELTTLLIPDENDSEKEINEMTEWVVENLGRDVPMHFSGFHPDYKMREKNHTSHTTLNKAREIAINNGLNHVYTGNVHNIEGDTTFCSNCQAPLIVRDWYELKEWNLKNGHCPKCKTKCPGLFEEKPGIWGAMRRRITI